MLTLFISFIIALVPLLILLLLPFWTLIWTALKPNLVRKHAAFCPPVSVIIACYNEEAFIEAKVRSILAEDNWIPGSELIVVSGGSTDRTNEILHQFDGRNDVHLHLLEERTWKIDAVNFAVSTAKHDFLVFSDCRQEMKSGSIQQLLSNLNDPEVGTVTASLCDSNRNGKASFFRGVMNFLAAKSSERSSCLNVFGALYAQRKSVFREIPADLLFDDLFVVVSTLSQRKRVIQEREAVIYDVSFSTYYQAERIQRLVRGLLIFLMNQSKLIFSMPKGVLVRFLIYKYLKLLLPFSLLFTVLIAGIIIGQQHLLESVNWIILGILFLFLVPFHKIIGLFIKINTHFFLAIVGYLFGSHRSNEWEKLNTSRAE